MTMLQRALFAADAANMTGRKMTAPVELSTAEMWQLSAVGACLLLAVQEEDVDKELERLKKMSI